MNNVQIDKSQVTKLFDALSADKRTTILTKALKKGAKVLQDNTKQQLRTKLGAGATSGQKYGKSLESGIKLKSDGYGEISVHIMGDFRLKFFEKGTKQRRTKGHKITGYAGRRLKRSGKGGNRGSIKGLYFFKSARQNEGQINEVISKSITETLKRVAL